MTATPEAVREALEWFDDPYTLCPKDRVHGLALASEVRRLHAKAPLCKEQADAAKPHMSDLSRRSFAEWCDVLGFKPFPGYDSREYGLFMGGFVAGQASRAQGAAPATPARALPPLNLVEHRPVVAQRDLPPLSGGTEVARLLALRSKATPGPWRKRDHPRGELVGTIVEGPRAEAMPYALEVLGEDYTGYGDNEQRARDVEFIAAAHEMADLIAALTTPNATTLSADGQGTATKRCTTGGDPSGAASGAGEK